MCLTFPQRLITYPQKEVLCAAEWRRKANAKLLKMKSERQEKAGTVSLLASQSVFSIVAVSENDY